MTDADVLPEEFQAELELYEIPALELLEAMLKDRIGVVIEDEVIEDIVLTYGRALKAAVELRKEELNEKQDGLSGLRGDSRGPE